MFLGRFPKVWKKGLDESKIGRGIVTIRITVLLRSARILRRVLETWGDCCQSGFQWNTTRKNTQKLAKNATETYGMLQTAFRPSCMNRASVFEWYKRFKEGRESVRDDERCGRIKEVRTPELIGQRVRVRVIMLRF